MGWFRFGAPGARGFMAGLRAGFSRTLSRTVFVLLLLASIRGLLWLFSVAVTLAGAPRVDHGYVVRSFLPKPSHRAEYPWIVAMIGYTALSLSLWLLAQPLASSR